MKNPIPDAVWDQHVGILAKTGRGKTVTAKGGAAQLMKRHMRCGVVDPTGAWWGMRLKADGKTPGFPMMIFGGDHADIPIEAYLDKTTRYEPGKIGERLGALVAKAPWSWIVDISKLNTDNRTAFMIGFAETLFAENKRRLNLFLDECHLYMPQQKLPTKASAHMTAACNNLVSGGRSRGFNITMISQRSAKVHKDSLTQAETLITLGMIAPQDIAAAEAWVKVQGDLKAAKAMLESLPALPVGTGWIYAPELGLLDRVKFPMIETFDSSRAPGVGDDLRTPTELGQINLEEIRACLAPAGRKAAAPAKTSPPSKAVEKTNTIDQKAIDRALAAAREEGAEAVRATIPALLDAQHNASYEMGYRHAAIGATDMLQGMAKAMQMPPRQPNNEIQRLAAAKVPQGTFRSAAVPVAGKSPPANASATPKPPSRVKQDTGAALPKAEKAILRVLVHFPDGADASKVATLAGYSAGGGGFRNACGALRTAGLLEAGQPLRATQAGIEAAGDVEPLPTGSELLAYWCGHSALGKAEREILTALFNALPDGLTKEEVAQLAGYEPGGGGFRNALGRLRTLDLITGSGSAPLRAAEEFA